MKKQNAIRILQLVGGLTVRLFLAGVVVPSLLRAGMSADHAGFSGPLHTMNTAGMALTYKMQNIISAVLGGAFGAVIALVLASPALANKSRSAVATVRFLFGDARTAQ
jgi:hypothetical protein